MWRYGMKHLEELMTVQEFAQALKVKECTVRKWLLYRTIKSVRYKNSLVRIPASEITRLMVEVPAREQRQ